MSLVGFAAPLLFLLLRPECSDAVPAWGDWVPDTPGWRQLMERRSKQMGQMEVRQMRFDAFLSIAAAGILVPNFTERGYEVVRMPPSVHARLNATLHKGLPTAGHEGRGEQIAGEQPLFVPVGGLASELLAELRPMHEKWGGVELTPSMAYGLRVYQRGNWMTMHFDKMESHIISSILHVDHDVDEPWPIVIEGYDGKTTEVNLQPGEMLFYESSKCLHGRPRPLRGKWYTSLFVHYRPKDWKVTKKDAIDLTERYGLWRQQQPADGTVPAMLVKGTGLHNPECTDNWCDLAPRPEAFASNADVREL